MMMMMMMMMMVMTLMMVIINDDDDYLLALNFQIGRIDQLDLIAKVGSVKVKAEKVSKHLKLTQYCNLNA